MSPMSLPANKGLVYFISGVQTEVETSSEEAEGNSASKKMENDISADLHG